MPRFFKLRDGCDWLWTDVENAEQMPESLARSIQRADAPGLTVEKIVSEMTVYRFHPTDRLAGQVSRIEWGSITGRYWVATREIVS